MRRALRFLLTFVKYALATLAAVVSITLLAFYLNAEDFPAPSGDALDKVVFRGVHVIDTATGRLLENRVIEVSGGRIDRVAPREGYVAPQGYADRDLNGAYAVSGFWDMHAHLITANLLFHAALHPMNGVLYIRDLQSDCVNDSCTFGSTIFEMREHQAQVERGEVLGPYYTGLASYIIAGRRKGQRYGDTPSYLVPNTYEEGVQLAQYFAERGVDFIKIYNSTERDAYLGITDAAKDLPLYVAGHTAASLTLMENLAAGHRTIEHARDLPLACSTLAQSHAEAYDAWASSDSDEIEGPSLTKLYNDVVDNYDEAVCDEVLAYWASLDSWYVPTHITREAEFLVHTRAYKQDSRLKYLPPLVVSAGWGSTAENYEKRFAEFPDDLRGYKRFHAQTVMLSGRAHRAGVKFMVGTDAGDMLVYPGFSYADEMQHYVDAGIPNADILRYATQAAADFSGMGDTHGSIAEGKYAELVFFAANPLEDIDNVRDIVGIYHQRHFYDESAREAVLEGVISDNNGLSQYVRLGWFAVQNLVPALF